MLNYQSARSTPASHSYRDETGDSTVLLRADRWIVPNWKSPTCFVATWSDLSRDAPLLAEGYPAFDPSPWIRHVAAASGTGRAVVVVANDPLAQEGVRCLLRMRFLFKLLSSAAMAIFSLQMLWAQDLAPRAYIITSLHSNAITLTWSFCDGGLNFNGTIPITGATGTYNVPVFSYYHSFSFFGRSANITASLPYAVGTFSRSVLGAQRSIYRSGLLDFSARLSVNLKGGPAMPVQTFVKWKQRMLLGASLKILAPTGQYDPTKLINWSIHRWAFKPEFGYSQRWGHWVLDGYAGVWSTPSTTRSSTFLFPSRQPKHPLAPLKDT